MFMSGFHKDLRLDDGSTTNAFSVSVERGTTSEFPLVIRLIQKTDVPIKFNGLMHAVKQNMFQVIPIIKTV